MFCVAGGVCIDACVCVERGGREGFARVDCKERYLRMFVSFGMKVICKNVTKCFVCREPTRLRYIYIYVSGV